MGVDAFMLRVWPVPMCGCWLWDGGGTNYGAAYDENGRRVDAHRLSWALHYGPVPAGLRVLHHCDTMLCVRPDHLFLGTQRDNMRDCVAKGRHPLKGIAHDAHPAIKVTTDDIATMRLRRAAGETVPALADFFGISVAHAYRLTNRRL